MSTSELVFLSVGTSVVLMTVSWLLARRWDFYSLVDVSWSYGIGFIVAIFAIAGQGNVGRRLLFALMGISWSLRLGTFLLLRLKEKFPTEDTRYQKIKMTWKTQLSKKFFWFFQFQAISQPILCLPFLLASQNENSLHFIDYLAVLVSLTGVIGESISDFQLKKFKADPNNRDRVCDKGLWKYSRHPNYFFEWVIWCGFALIGITGSYGFWSVSSPLLMFILLNFVTGVPPAEEQSLVSRGDLFKDYQKRTSRFFPWIPHAK